MNPDDNEECDHEWEIIDESFAHEFGTEICVSRFCLKCDKSEPYESPCFDDDCI